MMTFCASPGEHEGTRHVVFRGDDHVRKIARDKVAGLVDDQDVRAAQVCASRARVAVLLIP